MPPLVLALTGIATRAAPLAELEVHCTARERVTRSITVPNKSAHPVTFAVQADLPFVSGRPSLTVPPSSSAAYTLTVRPPVQGEFHGMVSFSKQPEPGDARSSSSGADESGAEAWAALRVVVDAPPPEDVIRVEAPVRGAAAISLEVSNPLEEDAEFEAEVEGRGLLGDPVLFVSAGETALYEVLFAPLVPGRARGSITLSHPRAGQLSYSVETSAMAPEPEHLPEMRASVGRRDRCAVVVENPTRHEASVRAEVDNDRNFAVEPPTFVLAPYSRFEVVVTYTPSSVGEREQGTVRLRSDTVGEWVYHASGIGAAPEEEGEEVVLVAPAGLSASTSVPFRNPFPEPIQVQVEVKTDLPASQDGASTVASSVRLPPIRSAASARGRAASSSSSAASSASSSASSAAGAGEEDVFQLLKQPRRPIAPFAVAQIPVAFNPSEIAEYSGTLQVRLPQKDLTWTFPLRGVAEAPPSKRTLRFRAKARERAVQEVELLLPGLHADPDEQFRVELQAAEEVRDVVARAVSVEVADAAGVRGPEDPLMLRFHMHAAKPFRARAQLVVSKASGGRWRWETMLEAEEPDADDVVEVEAELGQRSSVALSLTNSQHAHAPFRAGFTLDSAAELSVSPTAGSLPPAGGPGETIVVTFTPQEYGKVCHGRLVVETEADQWIYDVVGTQPRYRRPARARSRIDTRLDASHTRAMRARAAQRSSANFIRANAAALSKPKKR